MGLGTLGLDTPERLRFLGSRPLGTHGLWLAQLSKVHGVQKGQPHKVPGSCGRNLRQSTRADVIDSTIKEVNGRRNMNNLNYHVFS